MLEKLTLDRDFTRFINDPTFPYKVTVCIGEERVLCSGALLAQQSCVLEKKFREDDGVLMFEELLDVENRNRALHDCINFLHGAELTFTRENIEVILKFASWYKVGCLFDKVLHWLLYDHFSEDNLSFGLVNSDDVLNLIVISNHLQEEESIKLKEVIFSIIDTYEGLGYFYYDNKRTTFNLFLGLSGYDVAAITLKEPFKSSSFLEGWLSFSRENRKFVIENAALFDFEEIYQTGDDFSKFVAVLSEDKELMCTDSIKLLLEIQKDFLLKKAHDKWFVTSSTDNNKPAASSDSGPILPSRLNPNQSSKEQYSISIQHQVVVPQHEPKYSTTINEFSWESSSSQDSDSSSDEYQYSSVWVGNVPKSAAEVDLKRLFGRFGKINEITIRATRHPFDHAFVYFDSVGSARALLRRKDEEGFEISGVQLKIAERRSQ